MLARVALGILTAWTLAAPARASQSSEDGRLPAAGTRLEVRAVRATRVAVARLGERAGPATARAREMSLVPQAEPPPEPLEPTPLIPHALPPPGLAPPLPSPPPAQEFMGLDDIPRLGTPNGAIPPDVDGAVGPAHILEGLNNNYRLFDKANGAILSTESIGDFWAALGANGPFGPRTLYDPVQQRWIAVALCDAHSSAASVLLAVSQTSDPGGAWNQFRVPADPGGTNWADFPCVGFNGNWIAINVNLFTNASNASAGSRCLLVDYAQARDGTLAASFANGTGFCSAPVATFSPGEPTLYVPTHLSSASGTYRIDTVTGTPEAPIYTVGATRSRGTSWTQPLGSILPQAPPLSGASVCGATPCAIETQDAQIRSTPVFRDGSIWYAQTVGLPAGGLTHTAVQWTRLDAATGDVVEGGRIEDPAATGANGGGWYAYPHIAVNGAGDAIVCFTRFSSSEHPSSGYAARRAADPAGTLREPRVYKAGEDYYHKDFGGGRNRWGGYAKAQVDPSDDRSLWVVTEYAASRTGADDGPTGSNSSRWGTWWARIGPAVTIGPGPTVAEGDSGAKTALVPVTLTQPMPADVVVSYVVSDGTAAVSDGDYTAQGDPVVIPAGSLSTSIPVVIRGDRRFEADETFTVTITSAVGVTLGTPTLATVTIANDDENVPPSVTVLSPNGGETLAPGVPFTLTWLASDSSGVASVDLELSRDDGVTFTAIATGLPNDGHYDWDVTGPFTNKARLRVTARDPDGNIGRDASDASWSIALPFTGVGDQVPVRFGLTAIVPNPARAGARFGYGLPHDAHVRLTIADLQGRTLAVLVDAQRPAGRHVAEWNGAGPGGPLAAGVYFARCEADGRVATRRFALMR